VVSATSSEGLLVICYMNWDQLVCLGMMIFALSRLLSLPVCLIDVKEMSLKWPAMYPMGR